MVEIKPCSIIKLNSFKGWMKCFWAMPKKFGHQIFYHSNQCSKTTKIWWPNFSSWFNLGNDPKTLGNTKKNHCINGGNQTIVDPMIKTF